MTEQQVLKIREALKQLDANDDQHWTDDGLPRTGVVQKIANDQTIKRQDIQAAWPGFQRPKTDTAEVDPITGDPVVSAQPEPPLYSDVQPEAVAASAPGDDPSKNTGELMTEGEVRAILEQRVTDAGEELVAAQQNVKDAQNRVTAAINKLHTARQELAREFPPMTAAENIKQHLEAQKIERAMRAGVWNNGLAPGSQIDAAMQRSNSRGWRRPDRRDRPTQTGAAARA